MITERIIQIACGVFHTLILTSIKLKDHLLIEFTDKGKVYAFGGNSFGQLGIGNKKNTSVPLRIEELDRHIIVKIACGHHSAALTDKGEIFIWGTGIFGEHLSPIQFTQSNVFFRDIEIGGFFGAAIDDNKLVWTWGSNTSGELGLGDFEPKIAPFPNMLLQSKRVSQLSCGGSYVIALGKVAKLKKKGLEPEEERYKNNNKSEGRKRSKTPNSQLNTPVTDLSKNSTNVSFEKGYNNSRINNNLNKSIDGGFNSVAGGSRQNFREIMNQSNTSSHFKLNGDSGNSVSTADGSSNNKAKRSTKYDDSRSYKYRVNNRFMYEINYLIEFIY